MSGRGLSSGNHCELVIQYGDVCGCEDSGAAHMTELSNGQKRCVQRGVWKYMRHETLPNMRKLKLTDAN